MTATRRRPSGPPAASARPTHHGVGRTSTPAAERVSDDLRRGTGSFLEQRRAVAALSLAGSLAMGVVSLYQFGLVRRVPEVRFGPFDADRVDASGEAYVLGHVPDAALGLVGTAATLVLAGVGDADRARTLPLVPLALAAKAAADAAGGLWLTAEQVTQHRKLCSWCLLGAVAQVAVLPLALPEARAAWRSLRGRR